MWKPTLTSVCPVQGAECYRCGQRNHFAIAAHSLKINLGQEYMKLSKTSDDMFIGTLQKQKSKPTDWKVTMSLNKQRTVFKIYTGAQCNVISKQKYQQISRSPLQKSHAKLIAIGGHQLNTYGKAVISCQYKGRHYHIGLEVVDQEVPNKIGDENMHRDESDMSSYHI